MNLYSKEYDELNAMIVKHELLQVALDMDIKVDSYKGDDKDVYEHKVKVIYDSHRWLTTLWAELLRIKGRLTRVQKVAIEKHQEVERLKERIKQLEASEELSKQLLHGS